MAAETVLKPCARASFSHLSLFSYDPSSLVAVFQEGREACLQRLKAWKCWRQDGGVVSYAHDSCATGDEPLCAESPQQTQCSVTNSIIFIPNVPAAVSRAALQSAFGSLAGLNEVIPGPVRADLVSAAALLHFGANFRQCYCVRADFVNQGFTRRVWVHFQTPAAAAAAASILKGSVVLPPVGAVSCRLSNKSLSGEQRSADLELSSAFGVRLCVGMCAAPET
jgi:hypothetical protein